MYGLTERNTALRVKRTSRVPSVEPAHASIPRSRSARSQEYTFSVGAWRQPPPAPPPARERPMSSEGDMATGYAGDSRLSTAKAWKQRRVAGRRPGGPHAPPVAAAALPAPQNRGITTIPTPPGSGEHLKTTQEPPSSTQHATRAPRLERPNEAYSVGICVHFRESIL